MARKATIVVEDAMTLLHSFLNNKNVHFLSVTFDVMDFNFPLQTSQSVEFTPHVLKF